MVNKKELKNHDFSFMLILLSILNKKNPEVYTSGFKILKQV